jgi:hypothetical protein
LRKQALAARGTVRAHASEQGYAAAFPGRPRRGRHLIARPRGTFRRLAHSSLMSAALTLAHVGHWYLWIPYAIPVLIVLAASLRAFRQQWAEDRERERADTPRS